MPGPDRLTALDTTYLQSPALAPLADVDPMTGLGPTEGLPVAPASGPRA